MSKKRKRNTFLTEPKKRRKRKFYLFLYAIDGKQNPQQKFLLYDSFENTMFYSGIIFCNWFYFYSKNYYKKISNHLTKFIEYIEPIDNVKQTVGCDLDKVFKIVYLECNKQIIINKIKEIDNECQLFEVNIPRVIRFITHYNLKFLEKVYIGNNKITIAKNEVFEIPVWVHVSKDNIRFSRVFKINERYELIYEKEFENIFKNYKFNKIVFCWDKFEEMKKDGSNNCFGNNFYLKNFCLNFLRIKDNLKVDKMKIAPEDYYLLNSKKVSHYSVQKLTERFEIMCKLFFEYFQQALFLTKEICVPITFLFSKSNKKIISDFIYLSNKSKDVICTPPKFHQQSYSSNAIHYIFPEKNFFSNDRNSLIFSLDYSSMYPTIMLKLFQKDKKLYPYIKNIKHFIKLKENNPKGKNVYKNIILTTYGCFGIKKKKNQYLLSSNIEIAKEICTCARNLLERTIKYFSKFFKVLYCNTDNLVIKGETSNVKKHLENWNSKNKDYNLKIERVGTKLIIFNKQVRIWFNGGGGGDTDTRVDKLECIGDFFNSVRVCSIVRRFLKKILVDSIKTSETMEEFKKNFYLYSQQKIQIAKEYKIKKLFELVETRKFKTTLPYIEEGLDFFLPLYSGFNEDILDASFDQAKNFVDITHTNFRIEKRLEKYIKKVEDLISGCSEMIKI